MLRAAVIGSPIGHSISPPMQQAAFDALAIEARYDAIHVPPGTLPNFIASIRTDPWLGVNVTVPHKQAALALVDALAPDAREIGAVNTIVREGSRLTGYNTDVVGFLRALRDDAGLDPQGEVVVVLGAGGAARACVAALLDAGAAEVRVANRSLANAEAVAARAGDRVRATDISESALLGAAILVNSTTVGMAGGPLPDESPVPAAWLGGFRLVYDLVYRPAVTPLIRDAGARGISTLGGLPMLIYQGAASFELWTGRDAPVDAMRSAARAALGEATPC